MEVIVEDMQSFSQIVTTNKLKTIFFYRPGALPVAHPTASEQRREIHSRPNCRPNCCHFSRSVCLQLGLLWIWLLSIILRVTRIRLYDRSGDGKHCRKTAWGCIVLAYSVIAWGILCSRREGYGVAVQATAMRRLL